METKVRNNILVYAEAFDAWRVIPRLMLISYGYLVSSLYIWYRNIPTYVQEKCDPLIIETLTAKGMRMEDIKQFACHVVDVVGGPTTAQSTFVTTIIGLSTGIFGLYTTTGRRWDGWNPRDDYERDRYRDKDRRRHDRRYGEEIPDDVEDDAGDSTSDESPRP